MSRERMKAVVLQEYYITKRSVEVIVDIFYFSVIAIVVNGFITNFLAKSIGETVAQYILLGAILWEIVRITQYTITVGALWNIWSRNLSNMFITPMNLAEYMVTYMCSGVAKALIVFFILSLLNIWLFNFNIFRVGAVNLTIFIANLAIFAFAAGIAILALIFRYGTRIQAFAWSLIFLDQPLAGAFYPVAILPAFFRPNSYALPPTYVFEAARKSLTHPGVDWYMAGLSFGLNILYFLLALWFFKYMFRKSKETGQFARNEG